MFRIDQTFAPCVYRASEFQMKRTPSIHTIGVSLTVDGYEGIGLDASRNERNDFQPLLRDDESFGVERVRKKKKKRRIQEIVR